MASFKSNLPTILIVTVVTVLVWYWAAMETRSQREILLPVTFTGPDATWLVNASDTSFATTFEGSRIALERAATLRQTGLEVEIGTRGVPKDPGTHDLNITAVLQQHSAVRETGATLVVIDNPDVRLMIDRTIVSEAEVRPTLPGVQIEGDITVTPATVTLRMPQQLRDRYPGTLSVNAVADAAQLSRLTAGQRHTLEVPVRAVEGLDGQPSVAVSPNKVKVSFAIKSLIREIPYAGARVQISLPPEVTREFNIDVEPRLIENLTLRADTEIIKAIEDGRAVVLAFVHLTSLDCESRIDSKPVSYYEALITDENGFARGYQIEARVKDGPNPPPIKLTITPVAP